MILVSIVIPTLNRPDMLERLLLSIENQTMKNFEVIVVDDCSENQNANLEVINKFQNKFLLSYFTNEKRSGAPVSRNKGILSSKAELIALVDDDDEWLPEKLDKQVEVFNRSANNVGIVYTWTDVVDSKKNKIAENYASITGKAKAEILSECFISSPSVMVRKDAIVKAGMFDTTFPSCQDWDTWTRIIFNDFEVRPVKEVLTLYYKHDGPTIGTSPKAKIGYKKYYSKHLSKLIRHGQLRHLVRFIRLSVNI